MNNFPYSYHKAVSTSFKDTLKHIKKSLQNKGLHILMEIDMQEKMKKKLSVDMDRYVILGVYKPPLVLGALRAEKEAGLILSCNIIVYEMKGKVWVSTMLPTLTTEKITTPKLKRISQRLEPKLKKVIEHL